MLLIKMSYFVKIQIKSYLAFWLDPDLSRDFTISSTRPKIQWTHLSVTTKPIIGIFVKTGESKFKPYTPEMTRCFWIHWKNHESWINFTSWGSILVWNLLLSVLNRSNKVYKVKTMTGRGLWTFRNWFSLKFLKHLRSFLAVKIAISLEKTSILHKSFEI